MNSFYVYPNELVSSCQTCPFQDGRECTFTGGPQFKDEAVPNWIPSVCPKSNEGRDMETFRVRSA